MPRIGSMFVRLTLQLRLFLAIFGLSYRYPTDEIVADDDRILTEIRRRDPRVRRRRLAQQDRQLRALHARPRADDVSGLNPRARPTAARTAIRAR